MSSRPLHLCYLCSEYPPAPHGGIGSFTQVLGRELVKRGHRVTVLGMYPDQFSGRDEDQGVQVIRISRKGPPLLRFLLNRRKFHQALAELHARVPIDVIEGGELDVCSLSRRHRGISVLRMHGGPKFFELGDRLQERKERWSFEVAQELCAVSHCVAEGTRELLHLGGRPITVIHNPIDTKLFAPQADDLPEEAGLIVFAGTVAERKGIRQLIQAMPRVLREIPEARLEIYGGEVIDPAPPRLLKDELIETMAPEVSARVEWKGRVPRSALPRAIQRASVCVYPSHFEAMPIAWIEGMASGKAVVASRSGPGPEMIDDGVTGLLCDPRDPDSIADALIRALRDPELRGRLGAAARLKAQTCWDLPNIIDQNEAYYRRITNTTI